MQTSDRDRDEPSLFAHKFNISSFKSNPLLWNKEWDKVLQTLAAKEVYTLFSDVLWEQHAFLSQHITDLKTAVCKIQKLVIEACDDMEERGHFLTAWLLLEERDRQTYLFKAFEGAFQRVPWAQDSRAMCPEIKISSLLKDRGKSFIEFFTKYAKGIKDAGENNNNNNIYHLPSEWWEKAVDAFELASQEVEVMYAFLSILRNHFISQFLLHTMVSVLDDLYEYKPAMERVNKTIEASGGFVQTIGKTLMNIRDKPIIRCENCTKSPEEMGGNVRFMLCSGCRTKLDFAVHYCSETCQREDWRKHKKFCGKKKVTKFLQGTVRDPYWQAPGLPDHLRIPLDPQSNNVSISSMGFGTPHPSRPHSPALQRQVSLMNNDKDADYFLFNESGSTVRFAIRDPSIKTAFRLTRSQAMFTADQSGLEAIAEYLIKMMGCEPGLSRERILAQLSEEYGEEDITAKVTEWEQKGARNWHDMTFLEVMSGNLLPSMPMWTNGMRR